MVSHFWGILVPLAVRFLSHLDPCRFSLFARLIALALSKAGAQCAPYKSTVHFRKEYPRFKRIDESELQIIRTISGKEDKR